MKRMFKGVLAIGAGIVFCTVAVIFLASGSLRSAFLCTFCVPLLVGFSLKSDRRELPIYSFIISGPFLLALSWIAVVEWSWVLPLLMTSALTASTVGLILRRARHNSKRFFLLSGSYVFVSAAALFIALPIAAEWTYTRSEPIPPFKLSTLEGEIVRSSDLEGKVVVLDFWATWCAPCIRKMPEFERLEDNYEDDPDIFFAAVNTSWKNPLDEVQLYASENLSDVTVLYDSSGSLTASLGINALPYTVILGKGGRVRFRHLGLTKDVGHRIEKLQSE